MNGMKPTLFCKMYVINITVETEDIFKGLKV